MGRPRPLGLGLAESLGISRSLEGLNLRVDPVRNELVDAGRAPTAAAA